MKYRILTLMTICIGIYSANAQNVVIEKEDNPYITINKDESFFVKNSAKKDNVIPITKNSTFKIKKEAVNIYISWINPLKYKLKVQDSIINDANVELVNNFFSEKIVGLAGGQAFPKPGTGKGKTIEQCEDINGLDAVSNVFPELYFMFKDELKSNSNLCEVWTSISKVMAFELSKNDKDLNKMVRKLYNASNPSEARKAVKEADLILTRLVSSESSVVAGFFSLKEKINKLDTKNIAENLVKNKFANYYIDQKKIFDRTKKHLVICKQYQDQLKKSFKKPSNDFSNHFLAKTVSLPKSKSIILKISLAERILKDDLSLVDKDPIKTHSITVQKYDFITPTVSTGLFYSSVSFPSFGVKTNDASDLIITESSIDKNSGMTGVFLNLNIDIKSQFIQPLIQLGVDPTKENPYILLGGGVAIPVSNFSITGGPVWSWEPQLSKLKVDEVVSSTSVLEEDIIYKFQSLPRGFYIGLNYSF